MLEQEFGLGTFALFRAKSLRVYDSNSFQYMVLARGQACACHGLVDACDGVRAKDMYISTLVANVHLLYIYIINLPPRPPLPPSFRLPPPPSPLP